MVRFARLQLTPARFVADAALRALAGDRVRLTVGWARQPLTVESVSIRWPVPRAMPPPVAPLPVTRALSIVELRNVICRDCPLDA